MNTIRAKDTGNTMIYPDVVKRNQRRMTGTTYSTELTESLSEDLSYSSDGQSLEAEDQGLVKKLIKQEMVQSLNRVAAARMRKNPKSDGKMEDANVAIQKLAAMVLDDEALPAKPEELKPDQNLRDLLRDALIFDESDGWTVGNNPDEGRSSTKVAGEESTNPTEHELKDAPLDIWHDNFWTAGNNATEESNNLDLSTHAGSSTCFSRSSGTHSEGDDTKGSQSLQDYLANLEAIGSDSEGDEDDDRSVLSDISGLTDYFPKDNDHQSAMKCHRSNVLLESIPATLQVTSNTEQVPKKVSFDLVIVRKYERIICDNPGVSMGPSMGVGWRYKPQTPEKVDDYEEKRGIRKRGSALLMSKALREKMVRRMGHTDREIAEMVRSVNKTKFQRRQTLNNLGAEKVEFAVESAKRRLKSFLFLNGKNVKTSY